MKVKFYPKKYIDVKVCPIYEDKDAVIVQHTDTLLQNTAYNVEALGFKYGIKPTAFVWPYSNTESELNSFDGTGVIKFGVYIPTDMYRTETGENKDLPDYSSATLSEEGAEYYGREFGESKDKGFPNNGQQLFDYTNGVKGYDIANGVAGAEGNKDFIRLMQYIDDWFYEHFNRLPSNGSDRQGKIGSKEVYVPFYLGIRKTQPVTDGTAEIYESGAIDRLSFIHRSITSRWEYTFYNNEPSYNQVMIDSINRAFEIKGLFNDFVHWHRVLGVEGGYPLLEQLFKTIHETVGERNAWYTGYGEAVEYYWFKSMIKRAVGGISNSGNEILIVLDFEDDYSGIFDAGIPMDLLYERLKQPISVMVDLKNTFLEGKIIDAEGCEIVSKGNDVYIINIPFNGVNGFQQVVIKEAVYKNYKDFEHITYQIKNDKIITNKPVKCVFYRGEFDVRMSVISRDNVFSTEHDLVDGFTKIGLIDNVGQTVLIESNNNVE